MEAGFRTKRRQSSHCGDELFEFVDYTSVSDFERLVTAIEEILHSWGTKDGAYGVFSSDKLQSASSALRNSSSEEYTLRITVYRPRNIHIDVLLPSARAAAVG